MWISSLDKQKCLCRSVPCTQSWRADNLTQHEVQAHTSVTRFESLGDMSGSPFLLHRGSAMAHGCPVLGASSKISDVGGKPLSSTWGQRFSLGFRKCTLLLKCLSSSGAHWQQESVTKAHMYTTHPSPKFRSDFGIM